MISISNISEFYQNHKKAIKWFLLIFTALFTAFLYLLYYLFLYNNLGKHGQEIYPLYFPTQGHLMWYIIKVREIIDGYWFQADPGFYEYRNAPVYLRGLVSPFIYYFIYLFIGFKYLFVVGDFLLISVIFMLIFCLVHLLTRRYYISLFFTFMFLVFRNIIALFFPDGVFIHTVSQLKDTINVFSPYIFGTTESLDRLDFLVTVFIRPGFLFYIPMLIFLFLFVKKKKFVYVILCGIFYGFLFYSYPFQWIYMTIVMGLLALIYIFKKDFKQFWRLVFAGCIGLAISVFYWINQFRITKLPHYKEIVNHNFNIEYGHNFRFSQWFWYVLYIVFAISIYSYAKKNNKMYLVYYFTPLLLAGIIAFNIQVVLGFNIAPMNWHIRIMFVTLFLAGAVLFTWFFEYLGKKHIAAKKCIIFLMAALVISQITGGVHYQMVKAERQEKYHVLPKGVGESIVWMDENLPKDSVILNPKRKMSDLIIAYTSGRVFFLRSFITLAPVKEQLERIYIVNKLFEVSQEEFEKNKHTIVETVYGHAFTNQKFDTYLNGEIVDVKFQKELEDGVVLGYKNYKFDLLKSMSKYKIDYIYYGPLAKEMTDVDFDKFEYLEKVYNKDGVEIYKIIPEKIHERSS